MFTIDRAEEEYGRLSALIEESLTTLWEASHDFAEAERRYRQGKSEMWAQVPPEGRGGRTAVEREAEVNAKSADLRYVRDLADSLRQAALEVVRARRSQMSGMQSLLAFIREEMALAGQP